MTRHPEVGLGGHWREVWSKFRKGSSAATMLPTNRKWLTIMTHNGSDGALQFCGCTYFSRSLTKCRLCDDVALSNTSWTCFARSNQVFIRLSCRLPQLLDPKLLCLSAVPVEYDRATRDFPLPQRTASMTCLGLQQPAARSNKPGY